MKISKIKERISAHHLVRLADEIVKNLNIDDMLSNYQGSGTSSCHLRLMIKYCFYRYFGIFLSQDCTSLEENIHFMWLSGNSNAHFSTVNDVLNKRLKDKIQNLSADLVYMMN